MATKDITKATLWVAEEGKEAVLRTLSRQQAVDLFKKERGGVISKHCLKEIVEAAYGFNLGTTRRRRFNTEESFARDAVIAKSILELADEMNRNRKALRVSEKFSLSFEEELEQILRRQTLTPGPSDGDQKES